MELPELKDFWFCLEGSGRFDLSVIFQIFPRSPRLSRMSFQLTRSAFITDNSLVELANFTSRSRCATSYLQIDYLPARQTMTLFRHLPHAEVLIAEGVHFDEAPIGCLSTLADGNHLEPGAIPVLLPKLRRVRVIGLVRVGLESSFRDIFESHFLYPAVAEGANAGRSGCGGFALPYYVTSPGDVYVYTV